MDDPEYDEWYKTNPDSPLFDKEPDIDEEHYNALGEFRSKPSIRNSKIAWLACMTHGIMPPSDVLAKLIPDIEKQVNDTKTSIEKVQFKEEVMELLHMAKTDPDCFFDLLLLEPISRPRIILRHRQYLETLRPIAGKFTERRKYKELELFEAFGELLGLPYSGEEGKSPIDEKMKSRYRTYKNKLK